MSVVPDPPSRSEGLNTPAEPLAAVDQEALEVVPLRHYGRWLSAVLVLALAAAIGFVVFSSPNVEWSAIPQYLFDSTILSGVVNTLWLTVLSMAIAVVLGIVLALMKLSKNPVLYSVSTFYLWIFRGTPLLVQILLWFNVALFVPRVHLLWLNVPTNQLISAWTAAVLALSLNEGAYMAEIIRSGIISVDPGQQDAALALGLTPVQTFRWIILPQAMRVVIPPTGNQTIGMLKTTSLVSVVAAHDLLTNAQNIYARNFLIIELLFTASIWYLALTTVASIFQYFIERHFSRGTTRDTRTSLLRRVVQNLAPGRPAAPQTGVKA